ncbi:Sodium/hydrogen exchanger family-domain-containing protein [Trametes gibbosa]|nr:Sodium/hydrogen exchanger family-domain-containing protein [Trametes gibbosa]
MVSLLVKEKLYINEVVLGTVCGVIFGPYCANAFNPRAWGDDTNAITLEVTRITLAAGLFAIGIELPNSYLAEHAKSLLVMVVPTMAFGWLVGAAIIFAIFPPLDFISSLVIAACLTPTDPIISAAIVGGKFATNHVPLNLRRILSAESAANDGLAYPFLSISVYLTTEASKRVAVGKWFLVGWLYQVILGTLIGAVLGIAFSHFMKFSHRKGFIDRESYVAQYLALALFTVGVTRTLGSDDLLAAFAAGSALSWDGYFNTQTEDEVFSAVIDLILNCGCFVYIGAWMPFNMFNAPELGITPWRLVVLFLAILVLRRIPPLLLLYKWVPEIATWREALFSGHFGESSLRQMGVGAIFVSTFAVTELPKPQSPPETQAELLAATLQTIVAFVVLGSIIIHGLSIPFFSLGRNVHARTLSITRTWTARNGTHTPDWLLAVRRHPTSDTVAGPEVIDVERGIGLDSKAAMADLAIVEQADPTTAKVAEDTTDEEQVHVPELGPAAMISDATAGPATLDMNMDKGKVGGSAPAPPAIDPIAPTSEHDTVRRCAIPDARLLQDIVLIVPCSRAPQIPTEARSMPVNLKLDAAGNSPAGARAARTTDAQHPLVPSSVLPAEAEGKGVTQSGSGARTHEIAAPSQSQRTTRSSSSPRGDGNSAHEAGGPDCARSAAGEPHVASVKPIVSGGSGGVRSRGDVAMTGGALGGSASGGGGGLLGEHEHFPASQ